MIVNIDSQDYFLITSGNHEIRIDYHSNTTPTLYAHALYTLDELTTFVRQFKKKNGNKSNIAPLEFIYIELFEEKYPVKVVRNGSHKPFFKNNMVYASASTRTNINHLNFAQKIREQLFEQNILEKVSFWEDKLRVMSNQVTFRLLKSNFYHLNKTTKNITFNKTNIDLSTKDNDHIVFKALTNLSKI